MTDLAANAAHPAGADYTIPMKQWLKLWLQWCILGLALAFLAFYLGDLTVYKLRGSPQGQVAVHSYVTVPLKGNRQQYDSIGSIAVPCSRSVFPQNSENSCWLLRRSADPGLPSQ